MVNRKDSGKCCAASLFHNEGFLEQLHSLLSDLGRNKWTESWAQVSKTQGFLSLLDIQAEMTTSFCVILIFVNRLTWDERAPGTCGIQPRAQLTTDMQTLTARQISWLPGFPLTSFCTAQDPTSLASHVCYYHSHQCKKDFSGPFGMLFRLGPCNGAWVRITCLFVGSTIAWFFSCSLLMGRSLKLLSAHLARLFSTRIKF